MEKEMYKGIKSFDTKGMTYKVVPFFGVFNGKFMKCDENVRKHEKIRNISCYFECYNIQLHIYRQLYLFLKNEGTNNE